MENTHESVKFVMDCRSTGHKKQLKQQNKNPYIFAAVKLTDVIRMHKTFFDPEHVIVLEEDGKP